MKSLYLRIWLTVVLALAAFALVSGWMWQRHLVEERARFEAAAGDRLAAWGEMLQRSLPPADAPPAEQGEALREWSFRLRVPMALDDSGGRRIATSERYLRRESEGLGSPTAVRLDDGRTLWIDRRAGARRASPPGAEGSAPMGGGPRPRPFPSLLPAGLPQALGPLVLMGLVFVAVAAGAYPVVRRLTKRLEALQRGVEAFGAGQLSHRVDAAGRDEVAAVGATFNRAAERIETLVRSHQSLLANASHELRSPLARLKMAVSMYEEADAVQRAPLKREIETNVAELDALVEEVLLASRLDAAQALDENDAVDLLAVAAEEAARVGAQADGEDIVVQGSERLLRRALRNLLENARRYGGGEVSVSIRREARTGAAAATVVCRVCDRGPGVPEAHRERIFEPFFRLPGHAERAGGVGLGLSLVRQIVQRHGGRVHCQPRDGGGTCFVITLPLAAKGGGTATTVARTES